jgi:hypothetical protein
MSGRYRFVLIEEPEVSLPVRYQRSRRVAQPVYFRRADPLELLLEAFWRLSRRGEGEQAWAPALSEDPLTFLLDAIGDAVTLRGPGGRLMYANPSARRLGLPEHSAGSALEQLDLGGMRYERRCMSFRQGDELVVLEVLRRIGGPRRVHPDGGERP